MKDEVICLFLFISFGLSNAISGEAVTLVTLSLKKGIDDSTIVGVLNKGDTVKIVDETRNLFKVRKGSLVGWAPKFDFFIIYLQEDEKNLLNQRLNESYHFAKIPWGSSPEKVKEVLGKKYSLKTEMEGDLLFSGTILGTDATIYTFFNNDKKLVKVVVSLEPAEGKVIDTYDEIKEILISKYGPPDKVYEFFEDPYKEGDGYEEQAIKLNKGHFACFWPSAKDSSLLALQISSTPLKTDLISAIYVLTVDVIYESKDWGEESDRRIKEESSDF